MKPTASCRTGTGLHRGWVGAITLLTICVAVGCDDTPRPEADSGYVISTDPLFSLDLSDVPVVPGFSPRIAVRRDGAGLIYAASNEPEQLHRFDGEGRYEGAFGRPGSGPGELARVQALAFDAGDTLWVFATSRVDLWSPEYEYVRSIRLPVPVRRAVAGPSGLMYIVGTSMDPEEAPYRVRSVDHDGIVTPLPSDGSPVIEGDLPSFYRSVAPADDGSVWVAGWNDYNIRRIAPDGDTLVRIRSTPEWWRPAEIRLQGADAVMDEHPSILDIGLDCEGRLWVVAGIPYPENIGPLLEAVRVDGADLTSATAAHIQDLVDHVVRIYDPDTGELALERHFDFMPLEFLTPGLAFTTEPDSLWGVEIVVRAVASGFGDETTGSTRHIANLRGCP